MKALGIIEEPTDQHAGRFDFIYRDQFSVGDWGVMPLPAGKVVDNRPIAAQAAHNHELLAASGIPTTYLGCTDAEGNMHHLDWFRQHGLVPRTLRMRMVNIITPTFDGEKWDYRAFRNPPANNYMIPIEFIWRAKAGPESSFWKNIDRGLYAHSDFNIPESLPRGDAFPVPVLDHSSKYEDHDRYFSPQTAQELSGLTDEQWEALSEVRQHLNRTLTTYAQERGFDRPDGKQEFALITTESGIEIALADVAGTWAEDRFTYTTKDGLTVKISKQPLRTFHALRNPQWAEQCEQAKQRAEKEGIENWKDLVDAQPEPLEPAFYDHYNALIHAATNRWLGWDAFPSAPPLDEACKEFDAYTEDYKKRLR